MPTQRRTLRRVNSELREALFHTVKIAPMHGGIWFSGQRKSKFRTSENVISDIRKSASSIRKIRFARQGNTYKA